MNKIFVTGRLTRDPVVRQTGNGIAVCSFSIACDRPTQGEQKLVDYMDCVAWRKTAEFVHRYFCKGKPILVEGRLQMRDWQDRDGNKRRSYEINVENVEFCGGNKFDRNAAADVPADIAPGEIVDLDIPMDDELPFEA